MALLSPYKQASALLTLLGVDQHRLDMAYHDVVERNTLGVGERDMLIRDDARRQAIAAFWGLMPAKPQGRARMLRSCERTCSYLNHYRDERDAAIFECAFRSEAVQWMDVLYGRE